MPKSRTKLAGGEARSIMRRKIVWRVDWMAKSAAKRLPALPLVASQMDRTDFLSLIVILAHGSRKLGSLSVNTFRGQDGLRQKNLRTSRESWIWRPPQGTSETFRW